MATITREIGLVENNPPQRCNYAEFELKENGKKLMKVVRELERV